MTIENILTNIKAALTFSSNITEEFEVVDVDGDSLRLISDNEEYILRLEKLL